MKSLLLFLESLVTCAHRAEIENKDAEMKCGYDSRSSQASHDTLVFKYSLQLFCQVHRQVSDKILSTKGWITEFYEERKRCQ